MLKFGQSRGGGVSGNLSLSFSFTCSSQAQLANQRKTQPASRVTLASWVRLMLFARGVWRKIFIVVEISPDCGKHGVEFIITIVRVDKLVFRVSFVNTVIEDLVIGVHQIRSRPSRGRELSKGLKGKVAKQKWPLLCVPSETEMPSETEILVLVLYLKSCWRCVQLSWIYSKQV